MDNVAFAILAGLVVDYKKSSSKDKFYGECMEEFTKIELLAIIRFLGKAIK